MNRMTHEKGGEQVFSFDTMLADLAQSMRKYDEVKAQRAVLEVQRAELIDVIGDIDLGVAAEEQPEALTLDALRLLIINRKMAAVNPIVVSHPKALNILYVDPRIKDKKVRISANFPDRHFIGTSTLSGQGLSRWHNSVRGKINDLSLDLEDGGSISVINNFRQLEYGAFPLISRENDYQPAFNIEFI